MNKEQINFVRKQLEEHLSAINENTSEIQGMLDYLQQIESKVERLSQRLDLLQMQNVKRRPIVEPLTQIEKRIFLTMYTEENPLTFQEIANKLSLHHSIVVDHLSRMVNKGIPLQRSSFNDCILFKLDPQFKELQAKENIINISLQSFMD